MLLQWAQLTPQGPRADLAAVIFTRPVQVSSIRIFPTGAKPFAKCPDIIAFTDPDAFFLDVFFNALPVHPTNSTQESQRRNLLVPTRIAYAGGQTEFAVDMGPEFATRLIIFRGRFSSISLAVYGDIAGERLEAVDYEPKPLRIPIPVSLSPALDLAISVDPTALAERLLTLMPSPTPLPLLIRLMFCLKPEEEDWDNPDFPYVYSNFETALNDDDVENEVFDLGSLVQSVNKPLRDDVSAESLTEFAGKMKDLLGSDSSDDAYYVAKLLTKSACQQPLFSRILLQHIDLSEIFSEQSLDEPTVLCLAEAAASPEISRYFLDDSSFMQNLENLLTSDRTPNIVQKALRKLINRIYGWRTFEDALENPNGDFVAGSAFLKDISSDEFPLGCWLECMISRKELSHKLTSNPVPSDPRPFLKSLFQEKMAPISHQEFVMFVRAFLGVSTVLSMLAWSDSLGNDICCERTLNILVVWQSVNGYREILNHCLPLRQMARRLTWIKNDEDDRRPKKTGILVERLLVGLTRDPQVMLRSDVVTTVLSLKPPYCHISADEMLEMEKLARVAQDGLLSAFEEVTFDSQRPLSSRRLRVLRVSAAIISEELSSDRGQWHVLQSFWKDRSQRLVSRLITILVDISDDLNQHTLEAAPKMNQTLSEVLFLTAADFLCLIIRLCKSDSLTSRDLRALSTATLDLHTYSDAATAVFSDDFPAHTAAVDLKHVCSDVLFDLSRPNARVEPDSPAATVVLRILFEHGSKNSGRDPVLHLSQIYALVDTILPRQSRDEEKVDSVFWVTSVFPHIFRELRQFLRILSPDLRSLFVQRLIDIENGEIGLCEWILEQDLKDLSVAVELLSKSNQMADYRLLRQGQLATGIQLWESLISSSRSSLWVIRTLSSNAELGVSFNRWLSLLLDARLSSPTLSRLSRDLAGYHHDLGGDLRFTVSLLLLRSAQQDSSAHAALHLVPEILKNTPPAAINPQSLRTEIGHLFNAHAARSSLITVDISEALLTIMDWLASQEDIKLTTLTGVSANNFDYLCTNLAVLLSPDQHEVLLSVRSKLNVDDDDLLVPSSTQLPETIALQLQSLESLLSSEMKEPSTPKAGTKTPDILGVIISPPTAILRSPAATGLTKTYVNNDFRQLRQTTSTRLNTSRLPSTHVDEFENSPVELLPPIDSLTFQGLPGGL